MGLVGIWLGLTISLFYASAVSVWIIWRVNWVRAVDKARQRLGLGHLDLEDKPETLGRYGTMAV
jgi:MATE family multidrug resistance protein